MMRWRHLIILAVCVLLVLESVLRLALGFGDPVRVVLDEQVEYRLVPNTRYRRFGNLIEINRHGMRAPDHAAVADVNERRILLIGDSVIYGNHFLDQDETVALRLKDRLQRNPRFAGCTLVTMPAAVSSWGPVNQAAFLAKTGTLGADVALFVVSGHDLYDTPVEAASLIPYRTRASFGALDDAVQAVAERLKRRFFGVPSAGASAEDRRSETLVAMDKLAAQFKAESIPLILVYHPTTPERRDGVHAPYLVFSDWARSHSIDVMILDTASLIAPEMYRDHIHPTASGADIIAGELASIAVAQLPSC